MKKSNRSAVSVSWPTPQDYNEALQTPEISFADPELQRATAECDVLGLPRPTCGALASVYKMECEERFCAVRCFFRGISDQQKRYSIISEFVCNDDLPYTVDFEYQERGIRIGSNWFPILKMDWVEGQTLERFVHNNFSDRKKMEALIEQFCLMCKDLKNAGIAHGDLQHGNILINPDGELRLVDYDGMFVPGMKGWTSNEIGHRNYQHPGRTGNHFGPELDIFSIWAIFTCLEAISIDPDIYRRANGGDDCLLLRRSDFSNMDKSATVAQLLKFPPPVPEAIQTLRSLVEGSPLSTTALPIPTARPYRLLRQVQRIFQPINIHKPQTVPLEAVPQTLVTQTGCVVSGYMLEKGENNITAADGTRQTNYWITCEYPVITNNKCKWYRSSLWITKSLWTKVDKGDELRICYKIGEPHTMVWDHYNDPKFSGAPNPKALVSKRKVEPVDDLLSIKLLTIAIFWFPLCAMAGSAVVASLLIAILVLVVAKIEGNFDSLEKRLLKFGTAVRGEIVSTGSKNVLSSDGYATTQWWIEYDFPVQGEDGWITIRRYSRWLQSHQRFSAKQGDRITVFYNPDNIAEQIVYELACYRLW